MMHPKSDSSSYHYFSKIVSPSVYWMILLSATQAHVRSPCRDSPRQTLIQLQSRSRTPSEYITQPLLAGIAINSPLTAIVD